LARWRQDIDRAFFMADSPLAGSAYGVASAMNASPQAREGALFAGGLADAALLGAAPLGAPVRARAAPSAQKAQPVAPSRQPDVRYRELNADGQPMGAHVSVTAPLIGTGTRAPRWLKPPGWQGNADVKRNEARGHLAAKDLGGSGTDRRNVVTLTHHGANTPQMRDFEQEVARRARGGEVIEYSATPMYSPGILPPGLILLMAQGSSGMRQARLIQNPAGQRR